jgi:hypothetical protein
VGHVGVCVAILGFDTGGALERQRRAVRRKFDELMVTKSLTEVSIMDAIEIWVNYWRLLDVGLIRSSWQHISSL